MEDVLQKSCRYCNPCMFAYVPFSSFSSSSQHRQQPPPHKKSKKQEQQERILVRPLSVRHADGQVPYFCKENPSLALADRPPELIPNTICAQDPYEYRDGHPRVLAPFGDGIKKTEAAIVAADDRYNLSEYVTGFRGFISNENHVCPSNGYSIIFTLFPLLYTVRSSFFLTVLRP